MLYAEPGMHALFGTTLVEVKAVDANGMLCLRDCQGQVYPSVDPISVSPLPLLGGIDEAHQKRLSSQAPKNKTSEELALANVRADVIKRYLSGEILRAKAMSDLGIGSSVFHKLIRQFDGSPLSICREKRGNKKGARRLSQEQEYAMALAIETGLAVPGGSESYAYELLDAICIEQGIVTPSIKSLRRRISEIPIIDLAKEQIGSRQASLQCGLKVGSINADFPLQVVQIDHTKADIFIIDDLGNNVKRPWISLAIDVYSRVILGFYVGLSSPSISTLAPLMHCCVFDKVRLLQLIDCTDIDYEFSGVPLTVVTDNAKEFHSSAFVGACARHGIEVRYRQPGRPHEGGVVERVIGTFMRKLHRLPGTTFSNVVEKGKNKTIAHGKFTIRDLAYWLVRSINIYHNTVHSEINKPPRSAWNEFYENHRRPAVLINSNQFILGFMPQTIRTVTKMGVEFSHAYYSSEALAAIVGQKVMVKYNPLDLRRIWILRAEDYLELTCLKDMSMEFSEDDRKLKRNLESKSYRHFEKAAHSASLSLHRDMERISKENESAMLGHKNQQETSSVESKLVSLPDYSTRAIPYSSRE